MKKELEIEKKDLKQYFKEINYNYKDDFDLIKKITYLTKTRKVDSESGEFENYKINWGCEQSFLMRSIAKHYKPNSFFEIGTGRGTTCYSICDLDSLKKIVTVDIIPFKEKRNYAIGYKEKQLSMYDIHELIDLKEKEKITFFQRDQNLQNFVNVNKSNYEMLFIDGSHEDENIILNDFQLCFALSTKKSVIIWDDYNDKFKVKPVVDYLLKNYANEIGIKKLQLISFKGHLFDHLHRHAEKEHKDSGILIMEIEKEK